MATYGFSPAVVWPALNAASPRYIPVMLGKRLVWMPYENSAFQKSLINCRTDIEEMMDSVDPADLASIAAPTAQDINAFMKERKVDIRLEDWEGDDTIGVAAVIKILKRKWIASVDTGYGFKTGYREEAYVLTDEDKSKPTVRVEKVGPETMVTVPVEGGYEVSLITHDVKRNPLTAFDLYLYLMACPELAERLDYRGVMFPSLLFEDLRPDFSPLIGMYTYDANGGYWWISQAVEQVKFAMGPYGISAVAAFAAAVTLECVRMPKEPEEDIYVFDSDGLWALRRTGYPAPVMVGYFTRDEYASEDVDVTKLDW